MGSLLALSTMAKVALAATAASTVMSSVSQVRAAQHAEKIGEYNAAIMDKAAGQQEAASQVKAREALRQARLRKSRVLALAAASGGGAVDVDVMNAIAGFEEEGNLEARTILYEGHEGARGMRAKGGAIKYEGLAESAALKNKAAGTIMGGVSSLASKYGAYTTQGKY